LKKEIKSKYLVNKAPESLFSQLQCIMLAPYFCRAFFSDNKLLCTGNAVVTDDFQIRKCPQRLQLLHTPNLFYKTPNLFYKTPNLFYKT